MNSAIWFTICARNYLAYALTLRQSVLAVNPGATFFIFLADAAVEGGDPCDGIIPTDAIALPDPWDMAFRYSVMEYATAVKPFCFAHLFEREGAPAAIYLDPDILVMRELAPVSDALAAGASAVLTPHLTAPLADDRSPSDLDILRSGTFNLGFAAFANVPEARRFLDWWGRRLATECFSDPGAGLFVDQKFAEFAPSFIERCAILRDPGLNVAYWNLAHRPLARTADGWTAAGAPLRFFHFSGVVPGDAGVFSKHQDRFSPEDLGPGRALLEDYLGRLEANGHAKWRTVPYAHDRYTDGTLIPAEARRLYARGEISKGTGRDALFAPDHDALNAPAPDVDQTPVPITRFMRETWRMRDDLKELFPLSTAAGRRGFHRWFVLNAERERRAAPVHIDAARANGEGPAGVEIAARKLLQKLPPGLKKILRG